MSDLLQTQAIQRIQTEGLSTYTLGGYLPEFFQVDNEIKSNLDKLVREEVETYLQTAIPLKLQQDVKKSKEELAEVERELHNS